MAVTSRLYHPRAVRAAGLRGGNRMRDRLFIVALALALAVGCKSTGEVASEQTAAPAGEFKAQGEIRYRGGSASFDETRVVGPHANLSRRSDGSWAGNLMDGT